MKTHIKPLISILSATMALSAGAAQAGDDHEFHDRAKVVSSTPVYAQVNEPRRECWTEYRSREVYSKSNNTGGAIIGAVFGGLVGSTVGKGNGKVAAAAVGAATGAVIGDRWNGRGSTSRYEQQPVEHCRTVDHYRQEVVGYDVVYRYNGRNYNTRMPYAPGEWLNLKVDFAVADYQQGGRWHESRSHW